MNVLQELKSYFNNLRCYSRDLNKVQPQINPIPIYQLQNSSYLHNSSYLNNSTYLHLKIVKKNRLKNHLRYLNLRILNNRILNNNNRIIISKIHNNYRPKVHNQ